MPTYSLINNGDTGLVVRTTLNDLLGDINNGVYIGPTGADGTSGVSGTSGTSGTSGVDGSSGASGTNGTSGTSGVNGTSGTSGNSGTSGTSGTSGNTGTSGTSPFPADFFETYIDPTGTTASILSTTSSWVNNILGPTGISGTLAGMRHYDTTYVYEAVEDNVWLRYLISGITASGTTGSVVKFTSETTIGNSSITDTGSKIEIGNTNTAHIEIDYVSPKINLIVSTFSQDIQVERGTLKLVSYGEETRLLLGGLTNQFLIVDGSGVVVGTASPGGSTDALFEIGTGTQSLETTSFIGPAAIAGTYAIAIGPAANATFVANNGGVAIGRNSTSGGGVAIGHASRGTFEGIGLGNSANASGGGVSVGFACSNGNARGVGVGLYTAANSGIMVGWQGESVARSVSIGERTRVATSDNVVIGSNNRQLTSGIFNTVVNSGSSDAWAITEITASRGVSIFGGIGHRMFSGTSSVIIGGSGNILSEQAGLVSINNGTQNTSTAGLTFSMSGKASFVAISNTGQAYDYGDNSTLISNANVWLGATTSGSPTMAGATTRFVAISSPQFNLGLTTSKISLINSDDVTIPDSVSNTIVLNRSGFTASNSDTLYTLNIDANSYKVGGTAGWTGTFSTGDSRIATVIGGLITDVS